eukprot:4742274-Amphidinium_carterae.1
MTPVDTKEETAARARSEELMTAQLMTCAPSAPQPDGDDDEDEPEDKEKGELPQVPEHPQGDEGRRSCTSTMFSCFIYVDSRRDEDRGSSQG